MDARKVERAYAAWARIYDRVFGPIFRLSRERAAGALNVRPGERVLEVGVGTGLLLPLYPRDCRVIGIDLSEAMLEKARQRVRDLGLEHVELSTMDAGALQFPDSSFDLVVAAYVVTAVPDHRRLLAEMIRVCRPGGRLVMVNHLISTNPVLAALERLVSPLCTYLGFRTDLSLGDVLEGRPLAIERHEKLPPLGFWHLIACRNGKAAASPDPADRFAAGAGLPGAAQRDGWRTRCSDAAARVAAEGEDAGLVVAQRSPRRAR